MFFRGKYGKLSPNYQIPTLSVPLKGDGKMENTGVNRDRSRLFSLLFLCRDMLWMFIRIASVRQLHMLRVLIRIASVIRFLWVPTTFISTEKYGKLSLNYPCYPSWFKAIQVIAIMKIMRILDDSSGLVPSLVTGFTHDAFQDMSLSIIKPPKWPVCPAKTQISGLGW